MLWKTHGHQEKSEERYLFHGRSELLDFVEDLQQRNRPTWFAEFTDRHAVFLKHARTDFKKLKAAYLDFYREVDDDQTVLFSEPYALWF